jgi:hypothetical protein
MGVQFRFGTGLLFGQQNRRSVQQLAIRILLVVLLSHVGIIFFIFLPVVLVGLGSRLGFVLFFA